MKNNPFKTSEEFLYGQNGGAGRVIDVEAARQEAELPDLSGDMGEEERQRKIEAVRTRRLNLARAAAQMVFSKDIDLMDDESRAGLYRASTKALFGFEDTDGRVAFGKKAGDMKSNLERLRLFLKGDVSQIEDEDVAAWRKLHGADEETRFRHADAHLKGKGSRDWDNGPSAVELAGAGMPGAQFGNFIQNAAAPTKDAATRKMRYETMNDEEKAAFRADTIARYERQIASANPLSMFLKTSAGISDEAAWILAKCFQNGNVDVKDIEAIGDGKEREKVLTALSMMRGDKKSGRLIGFIPQDFEDGTDFGNRLQMNIYGIQQAFAGLVTDVWDLGKAGIDELKIYAKGLKDTEEAREMRRRTDLEAQIAAALRQKLPDADSFMGALSQGVAENVHWIAPYVGPFRVIGKGKAALKGVKALKGALALDEMGAAAKGVKAAVKGVAVAKSEAGLARQMAALELYTERLRELSATADAALKAMPEATQALAKTGVAAKGRAMIAAGRTAAFSSFANDYIETADAEGISRAESVPSAVFVGVVNQAIERLYVPGLDRTITPAELKSLALRSAVEAFRHERSAGLRKWVADSVAIRAREMVRTVATEALTEEPLQQFTTQMALEVDKTIDGLKKEGKADLANVFGELWGKIGADGFGKAWRLYFDTVQESLPAAVGFGVTGVAMQRVGQMWRNRQEREISGDMSYDEGIVDVLQRERNVRKMMAAHWMKDGGKMEEARNAVNEMFSKARMAYKKRKAGDDTVRLVANAAGVDRKTAEVLHDCLEIEESMALYSPRFRAEVNLADTVMDIDEKKLKAVLPEYVEGSFLADKEKGLYSARLNLPNGEEKTLVYRVGDMSQWIDEQIGEGGLADGGELADSYEARRREMPEGAMKPWSELSDAERRDIALQGTDGFLSGRAGVFEFGGADGQKVTVRADDVISLASGRIADVGYVGAQATGRTLRHETFHALWRFAKGTLSKEDIEALYSHFPDLDPAAASDRKLDERMAVEFERYASGNFVPMKVRGTFDRFAGWAMDKLGKLLDAVGVRRDGVTDPVTGKAYTLSDFYDKVLKGELGSGELGVEKRLIAKDGAFGSPEPQPKDASSMNAPPGEVTEEELAAVRAKDEAADELLERKEKVVQAQGQKKQGLKVAVDESGQNVREIVHSAESPADASVPNARYYKIGLPNSEVKLVGRLEVRDAHAGLTTSTDEDYHDRGNQNRDDKSEESRALVMKIAAHPDPLQVGTVQPIANNGIVWALPNGDIIIGNHRVNGVRAGYEKGTAGDLEKFVREDAAKRGIEIGENVKKPLMVFVLERIESPEGQKAADVHEVVRLANESQNRGFNIREQAGNDAKILIDNNLLPRMAFRADGRLDETKCADAIGKFRQESGAQGLVGEDGMLTEEGQTRIQNAAVAALLGGTGNNALLGRIMDNAGRLDMASQLSALMKVTPELMSLAKTKPQFDIRDALAEALTLYTEWREKDEEKRSEKGKSRHDWRELDKEGKRKRGLSWEAFMSQGDMFRTPSEEAKILGDLFARTEQLRSFDREDVESAAGKKRVVDLITDYLTDYIENARNVNTETEDMFGGTPASRAEVLAAQRAKGESGARFSIAARREYDEVVSRYTNPDGTKKRGWMKAPNGKPTNLTERQWVQVRTPSFKKWFGDWEKAEITKRWFNVADTESVLSLPVVDIAGERQLADKKDIISAFAKFGEVTNGNDGRKVRFPSNTAGKMVFQRRYVGAYKQLFEGAVRAWSEKENPVVGHKDHTSNIENYHHYINKFKCADGEFFVHFTVRENINDGDVAKNHVHSAEVSDISVYETSTNLAGNQTGSVGAVNGGIKPHIDRKVSYFLDGVKGVNDYSSKVVDENGEPMVVYHGTNNDFTTFSAEKIRPGAYGDGFYFATTPERARLYGDRIISVFLNAKADNRDAKRLGVEKDYIRTSVGDVIVKNPEQIKLADPVTYDDAGNVIPLSQRFNPENPDVRFSIGGIYTGSAADYEKPSLHYVGSGEGSQVYGWGLYGSNVRGVAEGYAERDVQDKKFEGNNIIFKGKRVDFEESDKWPEDQKLALLALSKQEGDVFSAKLTLKKGIFGNNILDRSKADRALAWLERNESDIEKARPNLYEQTFFTDRAPGDESHLLKWYEPVSEEQLDWITAQAEKEGLVDKFENNKRWLNFKGSFKQYILDNGSSADAIYEQLSNSGIAHSDNKYRDTSEFLARAGIDGVKYPVDSYGGKGVKDGDEAGWNYVSFRDDNIRVDHKWVDGEQRFSIVTLGKYRTDDLRSLAHRVKDGDAEAIAEAGRRLAVIMPPDAVLVPMPSHTGEPTTMRLLADAIAANANGAKVVDALRSNAHESNYAQKKRGEEPAEIEMRKVADIPENAEVYIVDNVIDTGATYSAAMKAIPNAHILALADTDRTPEELRSTFKQNIDKILSRFDEAKGLSKEEIFKKFDNENVEIGWIPTDVPLPIELSVAKRSVKASEAYVLDHLHNTPHHERQLTADDALRMFTLINSQNEMRIVPQRGSLSIAFIAKNPVDGWDCVVIAPKRGEFYLFKTMFAQKRKPYQGKTMIRNSESVRRGEAADLLIRGGLSSIRDFSETQQIISNSLPENNRPSAELLEAMGRKAAEEKKNAGKGGKFQPARRASMSFAYPNLAWMSNEELLSAAVAAKMALGKSDKVSDRNTTVNEVQRKLRAIHPDWDSSKVTLEAQRILGDARKLSKEIRGDIDKGVSDSLILEHLPKSMRTVFGEEMTGEARRGWRLGLFQAKAEAGVQRKVAEAQERLMRDALEIETGMMHGDIERGFGVDLAATLLKVKENEYLKVVPKSSGGEAGAASGEVETMGESIAEDAFSADETVEEIKPKVSALVQAIAKRAEAKAEEESKKRKANRERAEKRVGNEDINDGKDAEPDTGDFAGGEISPEEVVEEAVKAGADLNNPLSFALFVMEMARDNWVKKHNLKPDAEPKHSLVYIQYQRKTLQDVYSTLARRVTYSRGRETVMNALQRLDKVTTMRGLIREAEFMGKLVGAKMIRESAQAMCERLDNLLKTEFQTGRQFKPDEESLNRKVPAMLERQARYMRHAMWLTPDGVSEETRALLQEKALAGSEFDEHGADKSVSRVIDEADMKLKMLADWGALKYKDLATVEAAVQWWLNAAEGGADAIAQAWDVREARTLKAAGILAKAVRNPKRKTAVDGRSWTQTANEIFQGHMLFHHLLEDLTRFAGEEERAAAKRYIDWLDLEIQKAGTRVASERIKMQDEMRKAVEQIYGRKFRDVVSELNKVDESFAPFMGAADDGVSVPGTKGRAMQLLVSLQQIGYAVEVEDEENPGQMKTVYMGGYYDNIVENGRVGQAEELLKLMTPADLNFIKWLRQWYERNRKGISDVSERIFGVGVMAELGNYMPVKMLLEPKGLENGAGATWQIFPKALTPRVKNKRDFDTSVDILTMWSSRLEESIQWKHHVELGIELRGIFGRSELQKAIRANHGAKVLSLVKGFITDILNGKGEKQEMMVNPMLDRARQFAALGGLGGNVGVMLKQTTSIPAFGFEIGVWRTFRHLVGTLTPQGWADVRKVAKSEEFRNRWQDGYSEEVQNALSSENPRLLMRLWMKSMVTNKAGDCVPALLIGHGIYRDGIEQGMSERDAMARMWMIVERTQQSSRIENRTAFQRRNALGNAIYQFLSTQNQMLNYEVRALRDAVADPKNPKKWGKFVHDATLVHFVLSTFYYWMGELYKKLLGQEPSEDQLKDWVVSIIVGPVGALYGVGTTTVDAVESWVKGYSYGSSNAVPALNWLGQVVVRDPAILIHDIFNGKKSWDDVCDDMLRWLSDFNATFRDARKFYRFRIKDEPQKKRK